MVAPDAIPSSLALSAALMVPGTDDVAAAMLMVGVVEPLATEMAPTPETVVTEPLPFELKVDQSVEDR